MARIRSIKPEFFRHEALQDLEIANPGAYPMMVFAGLWVIADREGRFEWRPRRIKLDVLPFLDFDMGITLSILEEAGLIQRYEHAGDEFGLVVSWDRHQIVGRDEPPSDIPAPTGEKTPYFRPLNQTQRFKVYERDEWTCAYCHRDMSNDHRAACLDHVIPYSKGGTNRDINLVTSCKRCNAAKADKTPEEANMRWPSGLGEYLDKESNMIRQLTINPPLIGGPLPPDKEGVKEKEKEKEWKGVNPPPEKPAAFNPRAELIALGVSESVADDFLKVRKSKRAALTATAIGGLVAESGRAGITLDAALRECCSRGWQGFKAEWMRNESGGVNGKNGSSRADRLNNVIAELTGANRHPAPAIDGVAERVD